MESWNVPRLWIANLSFEQQLDRSWNAPAHIQRFETELASIFAPLLRAGDLIVSPTLSDSFHERLRGLGCAPFETVPEVNRRLVVELGIEEVIPWGWTEPLLQLSRRIKPRPELPSIEAVTTANSRAFSIALEQEFHCGLDGAMAVTSLADLDQCASQWHGENIILKTNLGQSGRGHRRGSWSPERHSWAGKTIQKEGSIIVEPLVSPIKEYGIQWHIPKDRPPILIGTTTLISDESGSYAGSRIQPTHDESELKAIFKHQRLAVERIAELSYIGPVGIDAMVYQLADGSTGIRPLQDINARWTMGRLAMEWSGLLMQPGTWHLSRNVEPTGTLTSPDSINNIPTEWKTWWNESE